MAPVVCPANVLPDSALADCNEWESQSSGGESPLFSSWESQEVAPDPNANNPDAAAGKSAVNVILGSATHTEYDCTNNEYLRMLEPEKHRGRVANYLIFNTDTSLPHYQHCAALLEGCTSSRIVFADMRNIAEDPIRDIGTSKSIRSELYDTYRPEELDR
jgi:hypothetical protein